jgi:hypothetical protein
MQAIDQQQPLQSKVGKMQAIDVPDDEQASDLQVETLSVSTDTGSSLGDRTATVGTDASGEYDIVSAAGGNAGATEIACCPLQHALIPESGWTAAWVCSECEALGSGERFRCESGCHYDLCRKCVARGEGNTASAHERLHRLAKKIEACCPRQHPIQVGADANAWYCDSCGHNSMNAAELRGRCTGGCDYDLCESCLVQGKGTRKSVVPRLLEMERKVRQQGRKPALLMALMLRHISGKRDFDLFASPLTDERLFSKEDLKSILKDFTAKRLSGPVQERLSEKDSPMHFHDVGLDVLHDTITQHGYPHATLQEAVLEVLSHRHDYQGDVQMQQWMLDNLVHVKYDLTAQGDLKVGDKLLMNDEIVHSLDNLKPCTLQDMLSTDEKPVAILAGSWS